MYILINCLGEYQFSWRTQHSTVVINNSLYCCGGDQEDLPKVHDNEEKRKTISSVDIFHLPTVKWERKSTTGTPPAGAMNYACTNIGSNIWYFGGKCKFGECYHNNMYELNSLNNNWRETVYSTPENVPMKKSGCRMISFKTKEKDNLLVLGGVGPAPFTMHSHSQYIPFLNEPNCCITNETHMMCVTTSPGITGLTLCITS